MKFKATKIERVIFKNFKQLPILDSKGKIKKMLKLFFLYQIRKMFYSLYKPQLLNNIETNSTMECYHMDAKILQMIIKEIIESGNYNLHGIAYYTKIPFDVILDAACGNNINLSITPWAKIVELYLQIKPDISKMLADKLLEIKNKNPASFSILINETCEEKN